MFWCRSGTSACCRISGALVAVGCPLQPADESWVQKPVQC